MGCILCIYFFCCCKGNQGRRWGWAHGGHRGIIKGKPGEKSFAGIRLQGAEGSEKAPVETARWPLKSVSSPDVVMEGYVRLGEMMFPDLLCSLGRP